MDFLGPPEVQGYILAKVNFSLALKAITQDAVTPHTMVTEIMNHEWKTVLLTEVDPLQPKYFPCHRNKSAAVQIYQVVKSVLAFFMGTLHFERGEKSHLF